MFKLGNSGIGVTGTGVQGYRGGPVCKGLVSCESGGGAKGCRDEGDFGSGCGCRYKRDFGGGWCARCGGG